jgi:hypothetical protein
MDFISRREAHKRRSCQAFYMRDSDTWHKIDYATDAAKWMKPLSKGNETGLVCIPANWYVVNPLDILSKFCLSHYIFQVS